MGRGKALSSVGKVGGEGRTEWGYPARGLRGRTGELSKTSRRLQAQGERCHLQEGHRKMTRCWEDGFIEHVIHAVFGGLPQTRSPGRYHEKEFKEQSQWKVACSVG